MKRIDLSFSEKPHHFVAKVAPWKHVDVERLQREFGANHFISALRRFLTLNHSPHANSVNEKCVFDVYKQVHVLLPPNPYVTDQDLDIIRTHPEEPAKGRTAAKPGRFDTALINLATPGTIPHSIETLRAARIRVIFDLPVALGQSAEKFAYIEWYTPFGPRNEKSGMYRIAPSTRKGHAHAAVVPLRRLKRACHLTPLHARRAEAKHWRPDTVLDQASAFLLNWWVSLDTWSALRLPPMSNHPRQQVPYTSVIDA
jgi:hypothetical protein